jgi:hypothetical protein
VAEPHIRFAVGLPEAKFDHIKMIISPKEPNFKVSVHFHALQKPPIK